MEKIVDLTKELLENNKAIENLNQETAHKNATDESKKKLENKKARNKEIKEELQKEINQELTQTGKLARLHELIKDGNLNQENFEFMLKLIGKDEELCKQIDGLKNLKDLKLKQTDLETLKNNLSTTIGEIDRHIESLELTVAPKTNIPLFKDISKKKQERKNRTILKTKFELIIKEIETSKARSENKNLKEEYTSKYNIKEELDRLYKLCELGNINGIKAAKEELDKKYEAAINAIDKAANRCATQYRKDRLTIENYDPRLREYIYQRKNNYVTYAIEKLSLRPFVKYDINSKEITVSEPSEGYELMVYALIALYELNKNEKTNTHLTYISNNIKPQTALTKNAILPSKIKTEKAHTKK